MLLAAEKEGREPKTREESWSCWRGSVKTVHPVTIVPLIVTLPTIP